jgi:hypothetical protein
MVDNFVARVVGTVDNCFAGVVRSAGGAACVATLGLAASATRSRSRRLIALAFRRSLTPSHP